MGQEEVANMKEKYDLVSVPEVEVVKEEAAEGLERMVGLTGTEESASCVLMTSRIRLPWLIFGFIGQRLSAFVLKQFEGPLSKTIAAAFFIPIIMAIGGRAGIQSSSIIVRAIGLLIYVCVISLVYV